MNHLYRLILFLGFVLIGLWSEAQENFERRYPANDKEVITSSLVTVGTGYSMLGKQLNTDGEAENINVTFLNTKGNIIRSFSITYEDTILIKDVGQVIRLTDGNFVVSAVLDKDSLNKVITLIDKSTNALWTVILGQETDTKALPGARSLLLDVPGERIFHSHIIGAENNTSDLQLSSINYMGEIEFIHNISLGNALNERPMKMHLGIDSTIMILGTTDDINAPVFLMKMDTLGNELWTKSFIGDFGRTIDSVGYDLVQLLDTTWVIVGSTGGNQTQRHSGFLLNIDNDGNLLRTESFSPFSTRNEIYPNGIVGMLDSTVVISMMRHDLDSDVIVPVLVSYDLDSTVSFQSLLDTCNSTNPEIAQLVTVDSISATFLTTTSKNARQIPYLAKIDESGNSQCNESEQVVVFDTVEFIMDTLSYSFNDVMIEDSIKVRTDAFSNYSPPTLTLPDTVYCPEDPVNFYVDATVRGGVVYLWDDGTMDSTRTFTEEGMYMLTVTVREDLCFTLCDTMNITKLDFPMVTIAKNFDDYCQDGTGFLLAQTSGASIVRFEWNTGAQDEFLIVDGTPMEYSVEVEDECGNIATATTSVSEADFLVPNPLGLQMTNENLCDDGTLTITATAQSDPSIVTWSTGASNTLSISVNAPGTYTAEVSGFCPDSESLNVNDNDFIPPVSGEIISQCGDPITLTVQGSGFIRLDWSTGQSADSISVTEPGSYTVSLIDECGDIAETLEIQISPEDIDNCTSCDNPCLLWPNALHPLNGELENQTFGPKILAGCQSLTTYELRIYNRWGKNIFTSTDTNVRWNGAINGNPQPGGVYFYWARYNDGNTTCEREGDLTLLR